MIPLSYGTGTVKTIKSKSLNFYEKDPLCKLENTVRLSAIQFCNVNDATNINHTIIRIWATSFYGLFARVQRNTDI